MGDQKKKTKNSVMIVKPHIDLLHHLPEGQDNKFTLNPKPRIDLLHHLPEG
jgi:hypothetical protein